MWTKYHTYVRKERRSTITGHSNAFNHSSKVAQHRGTATAIWVISNQQFHCRQLFAICQCALVVSISFQVVKVLPHVAKILTKSLVWRHIYKKNIVMIAFANDFVQGGHVEHFRLVTHYRCNLIGQALNFFAITFFTFTSYFFYRLLFFLLFFFII